MMKKILMTLMVLGVLIGGLGMVSAVQTSTFLQSTGDGSAILSGLHTTSTSQSAKLHAWNPSNGNEGRVRIELPNGFTLNDLQTLSWQQYVEQGYISHVDVRLDNNKVLVFEYAKVDPNNCDNSGNYPLDEQVNTFDDKGIVDDNAYAWESSGPAGPCGDSIFDASHNSLAEWKTTYGSANIVALEFEVDAWISESEAFLDDITLNGALIEDFEGVVQGAEGQVAADMTFLANPNPLNFGSLLPGESNTVISTLSVGVSSLNVQGVAVSSTVGDIFTDANVKFSLDGINFVSAGALPVITIVEQTSEDLDVKLSVPVGAQSGTFQGTITYTIVETP